MADNELSQQTRYLRDRIDNALNNHLCKMKEGYDDSIVGFNEAWDIVRKIFREEELRNG